MSKWGMVKIEEVCEILDSMRVPVTASDRKAGVYPYYGANGIQDYVADYIFDDELVLLAEDGGNFSSKTKPIAYRVSGKCWVNNHAHVLKAIPSMLDTDYLCYSIMFYDVSKIISGTTRAKLNQAAVRKMTIPLPPLETQKQIAKTLDTAVELLAMRKQQLAELNNLIKSIFYDMFGDPVTNEMGWEIKTIAEIAEQKLSYGSGASAIEYDGITRYIRITDINDNGSLNDDIVSPSETSAKYNLNDGDILFARSGATVGKTLRYRRSFGRCIYAGYLIRLVPKKALVLPDYIYYFTKTDYYKGFIESNMKTVAQPNINAQQYGAFKICVPPLNLQTQFSEIVTEIEEQKALVQKAIDETQYLFDSLMSEYFE